MNLARDADSPGEGYLRISRAWLNTTVPRLVFTRVRTGGQGSSSGGEIPGILTASVEAPTAPVEAETTRLMHELAMAESRFAALFELIPDALIAFDGSDEVVMANTQAEGLFGYDPGEMLGK